MEPLQKAVAGRPNLRVPTRRDDARPIRVMLCDDSATIRGALGRMLAAEPRIEVVARVGNGQLAVDEVRRTEIDVIVLDIEMPVMDGMTALPLLLRADPAVKIIVASTLTTRGADIAMRALRLGAADYIAKPTVDNIRDQSFQHELLAKITGFGRLKQTLPQRTPTPPSFSLRPAGTTRPSMLAIGSSTGGPNALFKLIHDLGANLRVPVVLTQHMPAAFTATLADHLNKIGTLKCAEARESARLDPGVLLVAPGDRHLIVDHDAAGPFARLSNAPAENYCRPSVDPMLRSAARSLGGRVLVAMLTGMGRDGLAGTKAVVDAGGTALGQDEATSVVWGMPGAIAQAGLCHKVLPIGELGASLRALIGEANR